ncbi:MAG: lysophospholipid acyltransferase family protein [Granulosicoccus sp.]
MSISSGYMPIQTNSRSTVTFKQRRRQLASKVLPPLIWGLIRLIWKTCKVKAVIGQEHMDALVTSGDAFIPCYWHQQQIFCVRYLLDAAECTPSLNLGYLISPSADGDLATKMFSGEGVHIIRGSATRGGAQALREIYTAIRRQKISPIVTPDGPIGPIYRCKPGVAMLAQLSCAPLLPLSYAGSRVWQLRSWDRFMLPMPFSSIVIGIGPALRVDNTLAADNFALACQQMNERLDKVAAECRSRLAQPGD